MSSKKKKKTNNNLKQLKEDLVRKMLIAIGENPDREGLKETPARVVKSWDELYKGYDSTKLPNIKTFNNGNDGITYDAMISDTGTFTTQCEHHVLLVRGDYFFAYIPHPKGKILGLSKVARVVDFFSSKLQVQERLVTEIVDYIYNELSKDTMYKPLGVALVMDANHMCKEIRGIKKAGKMRTTKLLGAFMEPATRAEFMSWVNKHG
jgi:GTP cyclohydrolase I